MRIMALADLHLGKTLNGYSLIEDQKYILDEITNIIKDQNIDTLVIAGDIYDKAIASLDAINLFDSFTYNLIQNQNIKIYLISGNHDSSTRIGANANLLKKTNLIIENKFSGSLAKYELSKGINLYLLPFVTKYELNKTNEKRSLEASLQDLIKKTPIKEDEINILVAHTTVMDSGKVIISDSEDVKEFMGNFEASDVRIFKDFNLCIFGHLHTPQKLGTNLYYPGSILKYSLSEKNISKEALIIDINNNQLDISKIPLKPLRDLEERSGLFKDLLESNPSDNLIYFKLLDEEIVIDAVNILKLRFPNTLGLEYVNKKQFDNSVVDLEAFRTLSKDAKIMNFFDKYMPNSLSAKQKELLEEVIEEVQHETD